MTTPDNSGLDNIMEDLIVGHNFDYARKAILEWKNRQVAARLQAILKHAEQRGKSVTQLETAERQSGDPDFEAIPLDDLRAIISKEMT